MKNALVIQTAFAGDLVLTLPLVQEIADRVPGCRVTVLCIPATAPLLANHPAVHDVIIYDKRNKQPGFFALVHMLHAAGFDACLLPHRSLRSALLAFLAHIPVRIGFDPPLVRGLYTARVPYDTLAHEVVRNLSLLSAMHVPVDATRRPMLHPGSVDEEQCACLKKELPDSRPYIVLAPGSVWATKRWTPEGFASVARTLTDTHGIVLLGGAADRELCASIIAMADVPAVNGAGRLSFLASAAIIRDAALLISNDSAPVHLASAMGTPTVVLFGATVPAFGFSPFGIPHRILGLDELPCRPCGIHGGDRCPIGTFDCMRKLDAARVVHAARELLTNGV